MRGEPATKVLLTIYRKDENRPSRSPSSVRRSRPSRCVAKSSSGYAWIRVSQFQERTVDDFAKKLDEIYKQDPDQGLVLDLRNDPGGLLNAAVAISAIPARERHRGVHQRPDTRATDLQGIGA